MKRSKTQKEVEELRGDHPIVHPTCLMGIVCASLHRLRNLAIIQTFLVRSLDRVASVSLHKGAHLNRMKHKFSGVNFTDKAP